MPFLVPCEACNRHVMNNDPSCPFCGADVTKAMRAQSPTLPKQRLGRAAVMAFGATVASLTAACGGSDDSNADARQPASSNTLNMNTGTSGTQTTAAPSETGSMGSVGDPSSNPTGSMLPDDDQFMPVPAYGVPIMSPEPEPTMGAGGRSPMDPMMPVGGSAGEVNNSGGFGGMDDMAPEPEPLAVAAYGVFPIEPEPSSAPDEPEPSVDAGDAGLDIDPQEPEPMAVPAYGVPAVPPE